MEQLIILAIIVGASLLHGWWKKKQGEGEDQSSPWPGQPEGPRPPTPRQQPQPPPRRAMDLEEQLRRLLQGEERKSEPPPVAPPRIPPPPPLPRPARTAHRPMVAPPPVIVSVPAPAPAETLSTAAKAFLRGNQLESKVAAHMHRVGRHVTTQRVDPIQKPASPEIREAIGLLRTRKSQRAAIIASVVLGPPKAMET